MGRIVRTFTGYSGCRVLLDVREVLADETGAPGGPLRPLSAAGETEEPALGDRVEVDVQGEGEVGAVEPAAPPAVVACVLL